MLVDELRPLRTDRQVLELRIERIAAYRLLVELLEVLDQIALQQVVLLARGAEEVRDRLAGHSAFAEDAAEGRQDAAKDLGTALVQVGPQSCPRRPVLLIGDVRGDRADHGRQEGGGTGEKRVTRPAPDCR